MKWAGYAAGAALVALGLGGLVVDGQLFAWLLWFGGILIVHDAILLPGVLAAGTLVSRWHPPIRAALIIFGLLVLATFPTLLAMGRREDNPSILPLDYGLNLLIVLVAVLILSYLSKGLAWRK